MCDKERPSARWQKRSHKWAIAYNYLVSFDLRSIDWQETKL